MDNRGIAPSDECAGGMTIDDLVSDTAALIVHLGDGPARVVGTSLGSRVVQELALVRPDLVSQAVMMAAHGRPDPVQSRLSAGERALYDDAGIELPSMYYEAISVAESVATDAQPSPSGAGMARFVRILRIWHQRRRAGRRGRGPCPQVLTSCR